MNPSPPDRLALTIAQLDPVVGDIAGNADKARRARAKAAGDGADLVVFSELFICGYPPEDLVLKPALQEACRGAIEALAADTADGGPAMLIGTPWVEDGKLYNAVALLDGGRVAGLRFKVDLPNYGVFDEKRVFAPGPMPGPVNFRGVRLGVPICEDIWGPEPVECISETGGEILLVPNGSPYRAQRDRRAAQRGGGAGQGFRPAAGLCQPGRRPGRTGVRRRLVRAQRGFDLRCPAAGVSRGGRDGGVRARRRRLALPRRSHGDRWRAATRPITRPACWACATMWTRTAFPASSSACPAASTPRCARRWPSMRWAPSGCAA